MRNEDTILVSVVIITYNQEKYIGQAIEGVLQQRCNFPIEILISDDCSTDSTPYICQRYARHYPHLIRFTANAQNKGVIDNYFDTLLMAKGKYIADCAGDDYWDDPEKLQRQVEVLEEKEEVVLVYSNYKIYYENEGRWLPDVYGASFPTPQPTVATYQDHLYELINQTDVSFLFLGTACFRTSTFRKIYQEHTPYFRNKRYPCEDYQLIFFLLREGNFYYLPQETTVYRIKESVSHSHQTEKQFRFIYGSYLLRTDLIRDFRLEVTQSQRFFYTRLKSLLSLSISLNRPEIGEEVANIACCLGYSLPLRLTLYRWTNQHPTMAFIFRKLKSVKK